MLREARLLSALAPTAVRSPEVLAVCDDPGVIGAPFYVMEQIAGEVITDSVPEALDTPEQHARIADELIDALVELHATDWMGAGLEGFGKPTGYLERQLRRFNGLWEHNRTRELPQVEQVGAWLARGPQSRRRRRSSTATTGSGTRCSPRRAGAADRDLRLGDGDDRRPARRRRLHADAVDGSPATSWASSTSTT